MRSPYRADRKTTHTWHSSLELWEKLEPLAQQMRHTPTKAENRLWQALRDRQLLGYKFRRQHGIERFIVDFYCSDAELVVEVDGPTHDYTVDEDAVRQALLEEHGLTVLRFTNQEVLGNLPGVLQAISELLTKGRAELPE